LTKNYNKVIILNKTTDYKIWRRTGLCYYFPSEPWKTKPRSFHPRTWWI